ncbi:MAG: linear amide C-N hydrolase [Clostridiales bacterium]|uniref:linear amide C-N hydrolase n=1 Tax=Clostridium sp. N3C TaxID=1776758 RepID=UPI00092DF710|nr:C45 family peptidase [Clostridium sp. N3C]NLZ48983.1 linear amide C-N hydrolase [Clostridiales bacterium]SCN23256.1 Penicillin V acylase [Clostridium sp. N3C]
MGKNKSFRLKKRETILTLVLLVMLLYSAPLIKIKINRFRTLSSLKVLSNQGVYFMTYKLDYKLDNYLKRGSENINQLYDFIDKATAIPLINNNSTTVYAPKIEDNESYYEDEECSAFSTFDNKGSMLFARNLDLKGKHPILALYTNPSKGYSSISIVEMTTLGLTNDNGKLLTSLKQYDERTPLLRAPYMPRDGMNEKGLVVATLNVPNEKIIYDISKPVLGRWQVLRLLLDKAATVEEALALMKNYNCFDGSVHFFIADCWGNSAVVEYVDGKMKVIRSDENFQVVTNFYLSKKERSGKGKERYNTAYTLLSSTNGNIDEVDAMKILKSVKEDSTVYSIIYNQGTGNVYLAYNGNYDNVYKFNLKIQ